MSSPGRKQKWRKNNALGELRSSKDQMSGADRIATSKNNCKDRDIIWGYPECDQAREVEKLKEQVGSREAHQGKTVVSST